MKRVGTVQIFNRMPRMAYFRASEHTVRRALQWPTTTTVQLRNRVNYLQGGASLMHKGYGMWRVEGPTEAIDKALALMVTTPKPITVHFEKTDLFGGEANYSWVQRGRMSLVSEPGEDAKTFDRRVVLRAKAWADWTGLLCKTENMGDGFRIDATPSGLLQVLFVTFGE